MGTPEDVIGLSTLYMQIYFMGMPFLCCIIMARRFSVQWVTQKTIVFSDHRRSDQRRLKYGISDCIWAWSCGSWNSHRVFPDGFLCAGFDLSLQNRGSYKLSFSKLSMKGYYLKQIFQVGIPAGIQSTVINFSNALLQSSVNSFGSTAMAGYTAANNILGFLYVSINSVTQACMSFTSQNFGVGKYKRMDRVLIDCMILSVGAALVLGCGAYFFERKYYRFIQRKQT